MSFHNVRLDDGLIIYDTEGGPEYSTEVGHVDSGAERRQANNDEGLGSWDIGEREVLLTELKPIETFFRARKGKAYAFRWKDWADYVVLITEGRLGLTAIGTGLPTYDLYKRVSDSGGSDDHRIWLPLSAMVQRGGSPVTEGVGAGQIAIDLVNGRVTFVADGTSNASAITPGATTGVTLAADLGLIATKLLYLTGFTGADAALVNGLSHTINSISGAGPYVFTLATNTSGKTITLGSGQGRKYPQASEALTWSGQYDKLVRFGTDKLTRRFLQIDQASGVSMFHLGSLPVVEVLEP